MFNNLCVVLRLLIQGANIYELQMNHVNGD